MYLDDILALPSVDLAERKSLPSVPGVYFAVIDGERVGYVGATGDLRTRWRSHDKRFALLTLGTVRVHYLEFEYRELCHIEQDAIEALSPCLNRSPAIWIRRDTPGVYLPAALDAFKAKHRPIGRPRKDQPAAE